MSFFKQLLLLGAMLAIVAAQDLVEPGSKSAGEGRRRKRFYKFLFKAIGPIMSTLTTVVLVKAKIVLVALFFAGIYFFGHKIFPGGFFGSSSIISETPPPFLESGPYTGYHASDHEIISSYPGPEPFSSYGPPSSSPSDSSYSSYGPPPSGGASYSSYSKHSGGARRKRAVDDRPASGINAVGEMDELGDDEMYWTDSLTDMTFRFLGVNRRVCRKRFVCEFDFQARRNPILLFVTRAIGRDIFHNYRDTSDDKATSYKDCGRIYEECQVPKRKKIARRPFHPLPMDSQQIRPMANPQPADSYDTQENELDTVVPVTEITTTSATNSVRGKLILQPKRSNRFRRN